MIWTRRVLVASPFAVALVLNMLLTLNDRGIGREHIAGYAFLFATPWGWLLDRVWFGFRYVQSQLAERLIGYIFILWIPALLYSSCVWLLFWAVRLWQAMSPRSLK